MQVDKNHDADPRSAGSVPGDSGSTPQTGSKLRDKLQKLARWRIDPSSIEFPEDACEFRGGYAMVSRAFLVPTSGSEASVDDSANTADENKSDGGTPRRKIVAVKKLKIENEMDSERVLGLALREAGFLTELSHQNVIKLEGFVEDLSKNRVWLVFPWAANRNLKDFVASEDWEIPERISLIRDVAGGVEYLHSQNPPIYHGDLKSVNVLVNSNCRAIITDFGSARRLAQKNPPPQTDKSENGVQPVLLLETKFSEDTNTITLTGNQYTLRWAAPELLQDDEPGLWSDIWALGWIFYEVITNAIPFQNVQKDSTVVVHVIQGNLPSLSDHARMALIRALYSLMAACWSIDPSKRPTAEDCRKSIHWMPMITPDPQRATNASVSRAHSLELLLRLGEMHADQADHTGASKYFTEALGMCTDTADNEGKAAALYGLARVHLCRNENSNAATLFSEANQLWANAGNRYEQAMGLLGLADVHRLQGSYSEAITLYSEAAQIFAEFDNRKRGRACALWGLAKVHQLQGHYSEAVLLFSEIAQAYTDLGDRIGRAYALQGLANVNRLQKQHSQATLLLSEALQIYTDIGDKVGVTWTLVYTAQLHYDQDQPEDAIRLFEQAAGIFEEIGNTSGAAYALNCVASVRQGLKLAEAR